MRCENVTRRLDAYVTGEVSTGDRARIEAHLEECPGCREALARRKAMAGLLGDVQTPPVPEGFAGRVMAAARGRQAEVVATRWNPVEWWRRVSVPMHVAAAAAMVVGVALGMVMGWTAGSSEAPVRSEASVDSDPLYVYNLDYMGDAPSGSLTESYLALMSGRNGEGN